MFTPMEIIGGTGGSRCLKVDGYLTVKSINTILKCIGSISMFTPMELIVGARGSLISSPHFDLSALFPSNRRKKGHGPGRRYMCTQCEYSTNLKGDYRRHLLTHTGEKPHICTICYKRFSLKGNLQTHLLLHTKQADDISGNHNQEF
ncbi:zinc finger protein [Nephila pilipes]|uniref:Zinc finger protein n=1 Tax=Nephila pilipes TaxID=299642 RepID=A0A8X6N3I9_NEPPI|nr:zinc finger protein [Nephila pilipes]